jgi:hypothetical protein
MPWRRDPAGAIAEYQRLVQAGVLTPGSNVVSDTVDETAREAEVHMVDTGEWLLPRELLREIPFRESYSAQDWENVIPEDNKLLQDLIAAEVNIACTRQPTLHYFLGGYSNNFATGDPWVFPG